MEVNKLLEKIRSGRSGRDEVIVALFQDLKLRNSFKKMIRNQGWPKSAFDSIFTDAIVAFTSSVIRRKDFTLNADLNNYILVIGKRAYTKKTSSQYLVTSLDEVHDKQIEDDFPLDLIIDEERKELLQKVLSRLGRNCREVLTYWASNYSMKEIAKIMEYKSDMMARKKKYTCFKELCDLIRENPNLENLLRRNE